MSSSSRPRRISDLSAKERQQLSDSLVPVAKMRFIRKQAAARLDTIYSGALQAALGDEESAWALQTILCKRLGEKEGEELAVKLIGAAIEALHKANPRPYEPAVPPATEEERIITPAQESYYGADRTTETPPNPGNLRQATGGEGDDSEKGRTGIWRHFGAVVAQLRGQQG